MVLVWSWVSLHALSYMLNLHIDMYNYHAANSTIKHAVGSNMYEYMTMI